MGGSLAVPRMPSVPNSCRSARGFAGALLLTTALPLVLPFFFVETTSAMFFLSL
jgi:hypothetical protein